MFDFYELANEICFWQGSECYEVKVKQAVGIGRPVLNVYFKPEGAKRGKHIASILMDQCVGL